MAVIRVLLLASVLAVVTAQNCQPIRVDKEDGFGTLGTCCVVWDRPLRSVNNRKFFNGLLGGVGLGAGLGGFLNDSAGRNMSGGFGGVIGPGLLGGGDPPKPPAPAPVQMPAPAPAPAPAQGYPPPYPYPSSVYYY